MEGERGKWKKLGTEAKMSSMEIEEKDDRTQRGESVTGKGPCDYKGTVSSSLSFCSSLLPLIIDTMES